MVYSHAEVCFIVSFLDYTFCSAPCVQFHEKVTRVENMKQRRKSSASDSIRSDFLCKRHLQIETYDDIWEKSLSKRVKRTQLRNSTGNDRIFDATIHFHDRM